MKKKKNKNTRKEQSEFDEHDVMQNAILKLQYNFHEIPMRKSARFCITIFSPVSFSK